MTSPFPYETFAEDETFYGRTNEINHIEKFAKSSNNLVIYSKRRMGKSSLIKETFRENNNYLFIYCDIFDITSKEDFATLLLKALSNSIKGEISKVIKDLSSMFKRARLEYSIDPNSGKMSLKPVVKSLDFDEMIEDFFNSLFELSKKQKIVLAIDEFQQISTLRDTKIDAKLRKYIQENKSISYIFLGSKRHMLSALFEYGAPLFEEATAFLLSPLEIEEITQYTQKYLNINEDIIEYLYKICDGETKFMQHLFHILYTSYKKDEITKDIVELAVNEIINAKSSGYRVIFDSFSQQQKKAFKMLAKYKKNLHTKDILNEYGISKGSLQSALKQLFQREIIDKENDIWFIPDRAFELWGERLN